MYFYLNLYIAVAIYTKQRLNITSLIPFFLLKNINHKYPINLVALYYSVDTSQNILNKVIKIILLNFMLQLQSTSNNAVSYKTYTHSFYR